MTQAPGFLENGIDRQASCADVAELADALDSGSSGGNPVEVQVLSSAPRAESFQAPPDRRGFLLFSLAALSACRPAPQHARVDAAIAPLLPGSSRALAGLRIDRLKKTPWFRPFLEGRRPAALRRFEERTGLDAARDVWEVVWSFEGAASLAFLRGKFGGQFGQEPRFDVPGVVKRNYKTYYVLEKDGLAVLFLGSGVAMMGRPGDVERVIDGRDRDDEQPPEELIRAVAGLPACELWAVAGGGEGLRAAAGRWLPLKAGPVFEALEELRLHAVAEDKLDVTVRARFRGPEDARAVLDGLEALRQMAKLRKGAETLLQLASEARLESVGPEVILRLALDYSAWQTLLG